MALELQAELEQITRVQEKLQKRLDGVLNAIKAIEVLAQESDEPIVEPPPLSPDEEQGFTDQVRAMFQANPFRILTAVEIRDALLERSDNADPKITLIHAHNTLKRLFKQDEVIQVPNTDGRIGYKWRNARQGQVVDLMAALKKSLAQMEGAKANANAKVKSMREAAALTEAIRREREKER